MSNDDDNSDLTQEELDMIFSKEEQEIIRKLEKNFLTDFNQELDISTSARKILRKNISEYLNTHAILFDLGSITSCYYELGYLPHFRKNLKKYISKEFIFGVLGKTEEYVRNLGRTRIEKADLDYIIKKYYLDD